MSWIVKATWFEKFLLGLLFVSFAIIVVLNAWLSDDAYITFRTVDNWTNGYGLRWNIDERVQTYTHPLWMLLMAGCYAITHEIFFTSLLVSIALSLAAVIIVVLLLPQSTSMAALVVAVLALSKAFVDYTTSGLETPLTYVLLAGFLVTYTRMRPTLHRCAFLGLLAALGMVNRLDTALLFAPALLRACWETRTVKSLVTAAMGFIPLVLWETFALFYYGSLIPNTALAKLNSGLIRPIEIYREGILYLLNSLRVDPITLVTIAVALALALRLWNKRTLAVVAGSVLYIVYIIYVGGDFMSGRFLAAPLFMVVGALAVLPWPPDALCARAWQNTLLLLLVCVGVTAPYNPARAWGAKRADQDPNVWVRGRSITDERANYYQSTGLLEALQRPGPFPDHDWARDGRRAREQGAHIAVRGSVGFYGYFAGPSVHVVDLLALGDPLLARLPVTDPNWQIGHFGRRPPEGYLDTLISGVNRIADPNLARYYDRLALITRGDLWDPSRLREIWRMNTGAYDALLDAYAYRHGPAFSPTLTITNPSGSPYVYTYIWNGAAGETYLLDTASTRGKRYTVRWVIQPQDITLEGHYQTCLSQLDTLSDKALLNVGVFFAEDDTLNVLDMYERRYWFRLEQGRTRFTILFPPLEWHNAEAPDGFWQEADIDAVMQSTS